MSSSQQSDSDLAKELVERIQQFLSHQVETNGHLSEAAQESLTVATECIEQAFGIQRKPASNELFDIYKSHKTTSQQQTNQSGSSPIGDLGAIGAAISAALGGTGVGGDLRAGLSQNPTQFIQNLATNILSQATASASSQQQQQQQPQQQDSATSASAPSQNQNPPPSATATAPRERKRVSEAERLAAESFKNQGNDYMKQDKHKEAYDCYTQAINIDNNNAIYYSNRAAASSKLGDHQAALRDCQEAVEIDSTYSKAYGRMGLAYASMDDHQRAKESYSKALEFDPNNESYRNNLRIAEEKLASQNGNEPGAAAAGGADMMSMLRSMMSNPEVMQMAMRGLQDPRMQNLIFGGLGAGGAGAGAGAQNDPNNPPPSAPR